MKAQYTTEKQFQPVSLTLETQQEVDAIFVLLNHTTISESLDLHDQWTKLAPFKSANWAGLHDKLQQALRRD